MSQGGNRKNAQAPNSDVGATQDDEGGPAIVHAPNSDVGGSQDHEGGPPPALSTSPFLPRPPSSTPPASPSSRSSTPPRSPLQWWTPPTSPSPQWSTPPTSPSSQRLTPPTSPSLPASTPPLSPSPPQSPVSVLPSASTTDEKSPYFWGSNVDNCAEETLKDNKETILSLIAEYDPHNKVVIEKIEMLSKRYKYFRPIEGDGSCFYRSFIFSYLEHVLDIEDDSERCSEVTRFRQCIENAKQACEILYSSWMTQTSPSTEFGEFEYVLNLVEIGLSAEELYWADIKETIISDIIRPLRSLTEIELCTREDLYSPFLFSEEEFKSMHEFCQLEVRPERAEANYCQIMALVNALGIPLVVENLDTSVSNDGSVQINQHIFCPRPEYEISQERTAADLSPAERRRLVTLLYRPGHYDILYPK